MIKQVVKLMFILMFIAYFQVVLSSACLSVNIPIDNGPSPTREKQFGSKGDIHYHRIRNPLWYILSRAYEKIPNAKAFSAEESSNPFDCAGQNCLSAELRRKTSVLMVPGVLQQQQRETEESEQPKQNRKIGFSCFRPFNYRC